MPTPTSGATPAAEMSAIQLSSTLPAQEDPEPEPTTAPDAPSASGGQSSGGKSNAGLSNVEPTNGSISSANPGPTKSRASTWLGNVKSILGGTKSVPELEEPRPLTLNESEQVLLDNIKALKNSTVEDVQVPRADVVFVTQDQGYTEILATAKKAGHSRLPVVEESLDHVLGMVLIKDLLWADIAPEDFKLQNFLKPVLYVAPSMPVLQLLQDMQVKRLQLAFVVDEFGGIDGLVTIEDLIEEIVGDISDERDARADPQIDEQRDGSWLADARYMVEDFEAQFGTIMDEDEREEDIDTLGGLVTHALGRLPSRGEVVDHHSGIEFQVMDADPRRLKRLRLRNLPKGQA